MGAEAPVIARFGRAGGGPGGYSDSLEIGDDGAFTMSRRLSGRRAGKFAGQVAADELENLRALVTAARAQPPPEEPADDSGARTPVTPDSAAESIDLGDVGESFGVWDEPEGAWGELLALLRRLTETLIDQPVAALELVVGAEVPSALLRHVGSEPVRLAAGVVKASATLMDQASRTLGRWNNQVEVEAGEVNAGWQLDVGLGPEAFEMQPGTGYLVSVSVPVMVGAAADAWTLNGNGGEGWDE